MPFPDPPARMSYRSRFRQQLFVELAFSERHLRPLIRLFRQLQTEDLPDSFHFDALEGLDPAMTWQYAMNGRTLAPFELCLRQSNLNRSLRIVDDAMLFAACFIVVDGGISPRGFHIDYGEPDIPPGVSATLLTPLFPFEEDVGNLDYRDNGTIREYRYRIGRGLLFDGKFEHRTQAYDAPPGTQRVLVSWSIASSSSKYRRAIEEVIDSQTKG